MKDLLKNVSVVPVMVIDDLDNAVPLAKALVAGGLNVLEITLRTPVSAAAIERITNEVEGAVVGAGTVCTPEQVQLCDDLKCQFMVSPGATPRLLTAAAQAEALFLPGISSVSEMMVCMEHGHTDFKFFPAEASGGAAKIKALSGPFSGLNFCPTGGIGLHNVADYLALSNVMCVGGSWVCPENLVKGQQWDKIEQLAREAAALR